MSAHLGWVAIGPGAFDQGPSGMGVAGCGHRPLPAWLTGGIFRGHQAQAFHQFAWMINTSAIANFCYHDHGAGAWHTAPGLQGLDHGVEAPGLHVIVPCLFETLEACGLLMNRPDLCLKDDWLRRGGTDHLREPAEVGRAPMWPGPPHGYPVAATRRSDGTWRLGDR